MNSAAPSQVVARVLSLLCSCCAAGLSCAPPGESPEAAEAVADLPAEAANTTGSPGNSLVVHEWGTFTSMNGREGVSLDGLHHEEEELPGFVHSNTGRAYVSPFSAFGDESLDRPIRGARSKMETPVIYFYTKDKMRVNVRVDYEGGLITQWFPGASRSTHATSLTPLSPLDIGKIERSSFTWDLDLIPAGRPDVPAIPAVDAHHPWQFAREVSAAFVSTVPPAAPESERYIFYRGLGKMKPTVRVLPVGAGDALVHNVSGASIPAAFGLRMGESRGLFMSVGALAAGASRVVKLDAAERPKAEVVAALSAEVEAALVAQGLFKDEARAMVKTWAPTWFASEGTRVLSIVPRSVTDAVLPLKITPEPARIERVLVARTEILTPAIELAVKAALVDRTSPDAAVKERAMKRLGRLGRFLEPAVRSVMAQTRDGVVMSSGAEVLASFR
jgi:hypothetical protein